MPDNTGAGLASGTRPSKVFLKNQSPPIVKGSNPIVDQPSGEAGQQERGFITGFSDLGK